MKHPLLLGIFIQKNLKNQLIEPIDFLFAILLCLARERVEICGEGLFIKKYCDGDMEIGGKISALIVLSKGGAP